MDKLAYLAEALTLLNLALALGGVTAGIVIGALPGLSATMAVAVLVPFTFTMDPASGLIVLGAIYTGAIYGGSYSAILVNTPGTPSAIATTFDGYPMAKRGDGALAVSIATLASVTGGIVGALMLMFLAPPLAQVALAFGPPEYFWLAVFGLTLISALSVGNLLKGLIGACFGLLLSMVGIAVVGADVRFTMGSQTLLGGIDIVAGLIGLYCIPVLIDLVATRDPHLRVAPESGGFRLKESIAAVMGEKLNLVRSSVIGTLVGILPGAGGSVASLVSYSEARRSARHPERYGQGEPGGIIATEAANNATVGGGFIPHARARHPRHPARCGDPGRAAGAGHPHRTGALHRPGRDRLHLHLGAADRHAPDAARWGSSSGATPTRASSRSPRPPSFPRSPS